MSSLAPLLEGFFTERLLHQRQASPHTVAAYRDTFRLLLGFVHRQRGKAPAQLELHDLDTARIGAFLIMRTSSRLSQTLEFFVRIGDKMKLADDDNAAVAQVLTDYYRAFSTLDAQAVGPYFHEPSQLVSPAGVVPTPTRGTVAAAFQPVMDALRARGFAKSELINLHLKRLSATTAIAGGVAVRRKTDGQELERAGVVYLLQRTNAGWQFATVVIHDADDALRPE